MTIKIGINGFGRIGRLTFRTIHQYHQGELEVVAINDLADIATSAHLLKWDTNYGHFRCEVDIEGSTITTDGGTVKVYSEADPAKIPWKEAGVDIVIESTGLFTNGAKAAAHREAGAKKVLISAPASNEDITIVLGVNEEKYDPANHHVISNASCTTNGLAPVVKVLHQNFGVERGLMSTIHSYTNDQKVMDIVHKDLRRARAAAMNIIPTSTGAAYAVSRVMPEMEGRLHGMAFRVPVPTVSLVDLVVDLAKDTTAEEVNDAFRTAAEGPLKGILAYCDELLVSSDFKGNTNSSIVDAPSTMVIGDRMAKVLAWYDNEWGYSCRLADLATYVAQQGL